MNRTAAVNRIGIARPHPIAPPRISDCGEIEVYEPLGAPLLFVRNHLQNFSALNCSATAEIGGILHYVYFDSLELLRFARAWDFNFYITKFTNNCSFVVMEHPRHELRSGVCSKNNLATPEGAWLSSASSEPRLWDYSRFDDPPRPYASWCAFSLAQLKFKTLIGYFTTWLRLI